MTTISTRRFLDLPASLSLPATGSYWPWPATTHFWSAMSHSDTRNSSTAIARITDNSRLLENFDFLIGSASVWPSMEYFIEEYSFFSVEATFLSAFLPSSDKVAWPAGKVTVLGTEMTMLPSRMP